MRTVKVHKYLPINHKDLDDTYLISDHGVIRNRKTGKKLHGAKDKKGYIRTCLKSKDGKNKGMKMHRLVAQTFIPCEDMENLTVDHLNEVGHDNRVENLEWITASENTKRAYKRNKMKQRGENNNLATHKESEVIFICQQLSNGKRPCEVIDMLNVYDPKGRTRYHDLIKRLKRGEWSHITSQYLIK